MRRWFHRHPIREAHADPLVLMAFVIGLTAISMGLIYFFRPDHAVMYLTPRRLPAWSIVGRGWGLVLLLAGTFLCLSTFMKSQHVKMAAIVIMMMAWLATTALHTTEAGLTLNAIGNLSRFILTAILILSDSVQGTPRWRVGADG